MSTSNDNGGSDDGDYRVGYRKPPKEHQFKPRKSGNELGRPRKVKPESIDIGKVLEEPVTVRVSGTVRQLTLFEASTRKLVGRAINEKYLGAALRFIRLCETYEISPPPPKPMPLGGVLVVPRCWDWDKWMEMFAMHGPPPWPGEHDGLTDEARARLESN